MPHAAAAAGSPKPGQVIVTWQPVTRCDRCGGPVTYKPVPGAASAALTEHYARRHKQDLAPT
jgi:hypothetical protein